MKTPLLTIAIPTFNRIQLLRQTVATLLPQLTGEVEIIVMDNGSTDGTQEFVQSLGPEVLLYAHSSNVGSDNNFLSSIAHAQGRYVWTLSDDDFPCSNTVQLVLDAIRDQGNPGVIHLRKRISDSMLSDYDPAPAATGWLRTDRNEFLACVGVWVTFCSSTIVRRDCLDMEFLQRQSGTSLVPTSIPLQAAGVTNDAIVSTDPLVFVRRAMPGALYTVIFTQNLKRLLQSCRRFGYAKSALDAVYSSSLADAMPYFVRYGPLTVRTFWTMFRCSFGYSAFYTNVIPCILRKMAGALRGTPRRFLERIAVFTK